MAEKFIKKLGRTLTGILFWRELFYFLNVLLVSLIILEMIAPNIVLAYFNINYLLIIYIIVALILLIVTDYQKKSE